MHHLETFGEGWFYFPAIMFMIMFLIMGICFFVMYRKRRIFFSRRWFRQNWGRNWIADCYGKRTGDSASELLKRRYVRGEIDKEVFEQMKRDISDHA